MVQLEATDGVILSQASQSLWAGGQGESEGSLLWCCGAGGIPVCCQGWGNDPPGRTRLSSLGEEKQPHALAGLPGDEGTGGGLPCLPSQAAKEQSWDPMHQGP